MHPNVPCLEPRSRAIAEAIEDGSLPHGREDAKPVRKDDHVAYERRHFFGRELRKWIKKTFPNEKPAFLFDDIERNTHSAISADAYRSLKAERDTLQKQLVNAAKSYRALRQEKESIEAEWNSLKARVEKNKAARYRANETKSNDSKIFESQYWEHLNNLAERSISDYPSWRKTQRRIQKTGNLQEWLTQTIGADNREAEILKKVLSDFFQDLR